ncbi:alpha/beta hydrolase [Lachnospiraceae bacterium MD1]|uniref:Alpha/beta hydrolase n=1 Tax=Variimorphobacter saccharofermentans TaxID=2755051 RepID=A0A839K1C7_9FIRM|nr:alpha/beta hydrolase [Variimorphobacter saccharofermentans]MBB2183705.1 alpha/beta hydrolase [Variimorphobacter saccharofermentans]
MRQERIDIDGIPAIIWGEKSSKIYIFVHGKMSCKEDAEGFSEVATAKGYQVLSFDLPEHGERKNIPDYQCHVWNGVHDLKCIGSYVQQRWDDISVIGSSLGAYFSLLAYNDYPLEKCLMISPILDMERLIRNMMKWFQISEETLKNQKEIPTPMGETLYWDYYCYVKENPIIKWDVPTSIIYGSEDNLTEREVVDAFTSKYHSNLTVLEGCEHYIHKPEYVAQLQKWIEENC